MNEHSVIHSTWHHSFAVTATIFCCLNSNCKTSDITERRHSSSSWGILCVWGERHGVSSVYRANVMSSVYGANVMSMTKHALRPVRRTMQSVRPMLNIDILLQHENPDAPQQEINRTPMSPICCAAGAMQTSISVT